MNREKVRRAIGWVPVALGLVLGLNGMGVIVSMVGAIVVSK